MEIEIKEKKYLKRSTGINFHYWSLLQLQKESRKK